MATQSERRWLSENGPLFYGEANPADGKIAQFVRAWYLAPEQAGLQLDATDTEIFAEFGFPDPVTGQPVVSTLPVFVGGESEQPYFSSGTDYSPAPPPPPPPPAGTTAADYAASRPDLVFNWIRAHNAAWVASHPADRATVDWINDNFATLKEYLEHDFNGPLSGIEPVIPEDFISAVQNEIPGAAPIGGGGGGGGGGAVTQTPASLSRPTIQVGATATGLPVKQLVDEAGTALQWIEAGNQTFDLRIVPTYGALLHTAATDAGAAPAAPADLSKPTIQVGSTPAGLPIYQLVDEVGSVKQWIIDPGPPSRIVNLIDVATYGVLTHTAATDQAVTVLPQNNPPATEKSSSPVLLLALGVGVAWLWSSRNKSA